MGRREEQLAIRNQKRLQEVTVRNKRRLDKRKYFGVGVNVKEFQKLIFDTVFDEKLLDRAIEEEMKGQENFQNYLDDINNNILDSRPKIQSILGDAYTKGRRRVADKDGNEVKFTETVTEDPAVELLANQQMDYLRNISSKQADVIRDSLAKGVAKGQTPTEIAKTMKGRVKTLTKGRAETIARSEIVKTTNQGQLNTMKEFGATKYIYWTSQDKKVSKICRKNQGPKSRPHVYDIEAAGTPSNPMPVTNSHPNCRCQILIKE